MKEVKRRKDGFSDYGIKKGRAWKVKKERVKEETIQMREK